MCSLVLFGIKVFQYLHPIHSHLFHGIFLLLIMQKRNIGHMLHLPS